MQEGPQRAWQRIQRYEQDLIDLCERVSGDMDRNRRVRAAWHAYTRVWKKIWLAPRGRPHDGHSNEGDIK